MSKILTAIFLTAFTTTIACGGVSGGGEDSSNSQSDINGASRSLRFGQTDDANSRVAVSVAINNQESLVILNSGAGNSDIAQVLYRGADGAVALINVNSSGVPLSATTSDSSVVFRNFNGSTVDVTITSGGTVTEATGVSVSSSSRLLTARTGRVLSEDSLRSILRAALIAVRTFGCASQRAATAGQVSSAFQQLAANSCGSLLLDTVNDTVQNQPDNLQQFVTDVPNNASCTSAINGGSFAFAQRCANTVGASTIIEALNQAPSIEAAAANLPPEEIIQQASGFDPTTGVDVNHPTDSPFLGRYVGAAEDDPPGSGASAIACEGGASRMFIEIVSMGDPLCVSPPCRLNGRVEHNDNNSPPTATNPVNGPPPAAGPPATGPPPNTAPIPNPPPPPGSEIEDNSFSAPVQPDGRFSFRKDLPNGDSVNAAGDVHDNRIRGHFTSNRGCSGNFHADKVSD